MVQEILKNISTSFNWIDILFLAVLLFFIINNNGFLDTFAEVLGFIFSLFISYKFYHFFGNLLIKSILLSPGIANAIGFFIAWLFSEVILAIFIAKFLYFESLKKIRKNSFNISLGFIPAVFQTAAIFLFFVSLVFALPVRGQIKKDILDSKSGPFFVNFSQSLEIRLKNIFGGAVSETLNFLTIKPSSDEVIDLGFKLNKNQISSDEASEVAMFNLINQERKRQGIPQLEFDYKLRDAARLYGGEMLLNGFFAHVSQVDNSTPADRASRSNIEYSVIGENIAFAPDVYLAHQGFMNSSGHRKNILSTDFGRVGIGVVDAGVYGKMFVQEFTN